MCSYAWCCADTRPTSGAANTVTVNFYSKTAGGTIGDPCPIACTGTPIETSTFPTNTPSTCTTWPGRSGENSMNNGVCTGAEGKFKIDQRITCDCSGTVTSKEAFTDRCVIDNPTTLCAEIKLSTSTVNYFNCCPMGCWKCSANSAGSCTLCAKGLNLLSGNCVTSCGTGYFANASSASSGVCSACSSNCNACTSATACTTCAATFALSSGACVSTCPTGQFSTATSSAGGVCSACSSNCNACTSATACTTCAATFALSSGACVSTCPTGQFSTATSSVGGVCSSCSSNCNGCTNATACTTCAVGYTLSSAACVKASGAMQVIPHVHLALVLLLLGLLALARA